MSLSYTQVFKNIQSEMEDDICKATHKAAMKYLSLYREMIAQHNFSRHKITLLCAMGVGNILVDGKLLHERPNWKHNRASKLLEDIEESLDCDWAYHLDGLELN